jgi:two-component system, LuxR family, response regulator FixJ
MAPMTTPSDPRPLLCILDDDEAFRDSLVTLLADEPFDITASGDAQSFIDQVPGDRTACALVDLHMPGIDGIEVLRRLGCPLPGLPVIMMTGRGDVRSAVRALQAGAMDFIEKPVDRDVLMDAVSAAFARSRRSTAAAGESHAFAARLKRLTHREQEVLDRMLQGMQNKFIARDLAISPRTVEIHRARIMQKLEVESVAQLVRCATRAELTGDI